MAGMPSSRIRWQPISVGVVLVVYGSARILQVITGPVPTLALVALEVLSALAFALIDGSRTLGLRRILLFAFLCAAIGNAIENFGVSTGFPYGHYRFLDVMGPRILQVPILLGLAYIGMAYVSWILACAMVGSRRFAVPLLAACIMTAWDFAQDPVWSTMLGAWRWYDGGAWFGVPWSNYFGWLLTTSFIYLAFAWLTRGTAVPIEPYFARSAIVFYALCAAGNIAQVFVRRNTPLVYDGAGHAWRVDDVLHASALVSIVVMGSFAGLAWLGVRRQRALQVEQLAQPPRASLLAGSLLRFQRSLREQDNGSVALSSSQSGGEAWCGSRKTGHGRVFGTTLPESREQ